MKTYNIIGSSGLIGSKLACKLSCSSVRLNLIDVNNQINNQYENSYFEKLDITTKHGIKKTSKLIQGTDALFFKAGVLGDGTKSRNSELIQSYLDTNFYSLLSLIEKCGDEIPRHIIIDSSIAAVAKKTTIEALTEKDFPLSAMNFYGLSKLALEEYAEFISRELGCKVTVFRYPRVHAFNVKNIIWHLVNNVINNKTIELTGNPDKVLDFVHIDDVVKANVDALKIKSNFEILHVTAGEPITLLELANMVIEMYGSKGHPVTIKENAVVPAEPLINYLDDSYSRKLLKITETIGINQMIEETFNEIKRDKDEY